ncbi:Ulp1-like peptidase [Cucumis melo var. makuwa]|uniref:Ulp1-like peptidase n=1 Tax=Cucumis melo var. makuwa TaxID=1194695 RepID=A0A5D3BG01_CUCMM|nr:Ulp1-like peptidase [Cucumis melo var. makuwa]
MPYRREFNIITGLWGPKEESIQLVGNSRLLEKFFKDKECIYVNDLEDIFLEYEGDDNDIVKLALVYFIELSLLGKDRRTKVDIGQAICQGKEEINTDKKCTINGFLHALQVWAYDSIPTIIGCSVDKVNDDAISRMLRWVCQQSPKSQTISQMFNSPMLIIKAVIEMTPEEEQLKIASGELFENLRSSTIVQSRNGGSKRGREVVNDEDDFKNNIDELKGMMSTILKHIGLQKKGDEGDCKGFNGSVDHTLENEEVDNAKTKDVDTGGTPNSLRMAKEDDTSNGAKHIELKKKGDKDVHTVGTPPWLRFNIELEKPINVLKEKVEIGLEEPIDVVDDEHLDALFLFIRFKIKAVGIPSAQNFTTVDTIFMRILVAKWPQYKECIKENRPFDWKKEYRLVDYVVGSKEDFQDPWTSVDYVYSPFNAHVNHWVLLCLDLVSCQAKIVLDALLGEVDHRHTRNLGQLSLSTQFHYNEIIVIVAYSPLIRQPRSASVTRHSINLEQKMPQSSERPFCNVVFDLRTGQGLYVNRSEWRFTPIAISSEAMHRASI